jgi:hypothetical protein
MAAGVFPLLIGVVFAACGVVTLADYRRFGSRMIEGLPAWMRFGTVTRHRRVVGGGYLGFGLLLVLLGIADLAVA